MPGYIPPLQYSTVIVGRRMLVVRDAIDAAATPGYLLFWTQRDPNFKLKLFWRKPCAVLDGTQLLFDCDPILWSEDPKTECELADTVSLLDGDDNVVIERMHMKLDDILVRPGKPVTLSSFALTHG